MTELEELKKIPTFQDVPEDQLEWLLTKSTCNKFEPGDNLFKPGDPIDSMLIVLKGGFGIKVEQNGEFRTVGNVEEKQISGTLPYSRTSNAIGYGVALQPSKVVRLHKDHFGEMIREHNDLTTVLVHTMTTRVREFTKAQQQNEKLMSLGKLSAGLAHELNNPASAMKRSADELKSHLALIPEGFKSVISIKMTSEQVDAVNDVLFDRIKNPNRPSSLMEKSSREDEMAEWLENHGFDDGYEIAETLVDFGFEEDDLDVIEENVTEKDIPAVVIWINNVLTTERMVNEIEEAANRISELISSIKSYSHMDKGSDTEQVDIKLGIESTATMLKHKLKQKQVEFKLDIPNDFVKVEGRPGELNQVWTNLLDNAIDAVDQKGKISITGEEDHHYVLVKIKDNGAGIPEDIKSKIFDPFFTTKRIGEGTGLGLDVVSRIIRGHKADIKVKSQPGETEFTVCFSKNNK